MLGVTVSFLCVVLCQLNSFCARYMAAVSANPPPHRCLVTFDEGVLLYHHPDMQRTSVIDKRIMYRKRRSSVRPDDTFAFGLFHCDPAVNGYMVIKSSYHAIYEWQICFPDDSSSCTRCTSHYLQPLRDSLERTTNASSYS